MSPGEIDVRVVRRHLLALDEALRTLRKYGGLTVADLEADKEKLWVVERGLQLCAQNVLDVATHIAASTGHDVPDYAAAIDRLVDAGVLPAEFAARFRALAGFRNVVVHGYLDVAVAVVHRLLNDELADFTEFARHVNGFIGPRHNPPVAWDTGAGYTVQWSTPVPGLGHSSPVVWGDRIFLTTAVSEDPDPVFRYGTDGRQDRRSDRARNAWYVYAVDRHTGAVLWERQAISTDPSVQRHPKNSYAAPGGGGHRHVLVRGRPDRRLRNRRLAITPTVPLTARRAPTRSGSPRPPRSLTEATGRTDHDRSAKTPGAAHRVMMIAALLTIDFRQGNQPWVCIPPSISTSPSAASRPAGSPWSSRT